MSKKKNVNEQNLNEIKEVEANTNSVSNNATKVNSKSNSKNASKNDSKNDSKSDLKNTSKSASKEVSKSDLKGNSKNTSKNASNRTTKEVNAKKRSNKKVASKDVASEDILNTKVTSKKVEENYSANQDMKDKKITIATEVVNESKVDGNEVNESKVKENDVNENKVEENDASKINSESKENDDKEPKKSHKKFIIITIVCCIILLLCLVFSTIFAFFNHYSSAIIHGIQINGIDVSGLTREDAKAKISSIFDGVLEKPITLTHNEYETTIFPSQFDVSCSIDKIVDTAYQLGREKNIFQSNFEILEGLFLGDNISLDVNYSEETLDSLITEMETNFSDRFIDSSYYIEGNSLVLSKGQNGVVIEKEKLKSNLLSAIMNFNVSIDCIEIPTIYKEVNSLDISKIYQEVYRAPQDAYYTTDPFVIYPHVDGIDFAISQEEAQKLLDEAQEDCQIPLKILSPNVTTNQIGTEAFPDLLGTYYTTFSTANVNRSTNIRLAASKISGMVMMPGEVFSYNQVVGKRTAAAGFKVAAVYAGGEVTTGIGGGICQVSSTLYNSVLLANLEIVERYNHGFNTGYVPVGRDATVSWGGPDFKFKNTRNYPIKIIVTVSGGRITTQIFGLKSDNEYDVEIQSYVTQYISYRTIEQPDASLPKGQTKVIQNGSNGCKSVAYRILKQNGEVVSKTLLSQDTYNPHNKIVAVGTKEK